MKYKILILLSLLLFCKAEAQNIDTNAAGKAFNLEVNIPTQKGNMIYLGQYWKEATYAIDSAFLSLDGKAVFSSPQKKEEGQYFLYVKPSFQLDLLLDKDQSNIHLYVDEKDFANSTVSGSKDTDLLWKYLSEIQKYDREVDEITNELSDSTINKEKRSELETRMKQVEQKKENYTQASIKEHGQEWFGAFIKGLEPITLPHPQPKNEKEYIENKEYGKAHYFDNINLTDSRFWRTNYFITHINTYMRQWVDQIPDSLATAASRLVARTKGNEFCFKEMLSMLTNEALKSSIMGDENIWARLYEDYIVHKNIAWIDSAQHSELARMYELIKNNRVGMRAPNMTLQTIDGKTINTDDIKAEYILLYFYDPDCTHCKVETPKIHNELYAKYKDKGLEIVAINIGNSKEEWENFVNNNKLTDWVNCSDFNHKSNYWMNYDVSGIPATFVLDKDKIIVAKRIGEQNLEKFFGYQLRNK